MPPEDKQPILDQVAQHYAEELNAQFRTLNVFTTRAPGEIGRAHEAYLKGVIARFLPGKFHMGSGFIVSNESTSPQQDILIYNAYDHPPFFQVGDCVVVDSSYALYSVEVKTALASREQFAAAISQRFDLEAGFRVRCGLYAWEGVDLKTALDVIWDEVRKRSKSMSLDVPDAIYVRKKYLLVRRYETSPDKPYHLREIGTEDEGRALLGFVRAIWRRLRQNLGGGVAAELQHIISPLGGDDKFGGGEYSLVELPDDLRQRFKTGR